MRFHKLLFISGLFFSQQLYAQTRQVELSIFHEQVTLPWKRLPSHTIHPGIELSYLIKKNQSKRWIKLVQAGYLLHGHLFRAIHAGYGYRYEILSPQKAFQLQAGISAGVLLLKSTETAYKITGNEWKETEANWKTEGRVSVVLKASYQLPGSPALHVGTGINIWAQAPHVEQFTTVLPHRNYEIFIRYNFKNNKKKQKDENDYYDL